MFLLPFVDGLYSVVIWLLWALLCLLSLLDVFFCGFHPFFSGLHLFFSLGFICSCLGLICSCPGFICSCLVLNVLFPLVFGIWSSLYCYIVLLFFSSLYVLWTDLKNYSPICRPSLASDMKPHKYIGTPTLFPIFIVSFGSLCSFVFQCFWHNGLVLLFPSVVNQLFHGSCCEWFILWFL